MKFCELQVPSVYYEYYETNIIIKLITVSVVKVCLVLQKINRRFMDK